MGRSYTKQKGQTVADAFKRIMNESGRKPKKVWVDKGTEFYNQYVKALPFEIYSTLNDGKAVVVERFDRTLKQMIVVVKRGFWLMLHSMTPL